MLGVKTLSKKYKYNTKKKVYNHNKFIQGYLFRTACNHTKYKQLYAYNKVWNNANYIQLHKSV